MTTQIPDVIYYNGRRRELMATPLEAYFAQGSARPDSKCSYSALRRGYIATWRLDEGHLYLVNLKPGMDNGDKLTVSSLFPGQGRRVFASWFTGRLRIAEGRCLASMSGGFMSAHEREILVEVVNGQAFDTRVLELAFLMPADWPDEVMGNGWCLQ